MLLFNFQLSQRRSKISKTVNNLKVSISMSNVINSCFHHHHHHHHDSQSYISRSGSSPSRPTTSTTSRPGSSTSRTTSATSRPGSSSGRRATAPPSEGKVGFRWDKERPKNLFPKIHLIGLFSFSEDPAIVNPGVYRKRHNFTEPRPSKLPRIGAKKLKHSQVLYTSPHPYIAIQSNPIHPLVVPWCYIHLIWWTLSHHNFTEPKGWRSSSILSSEAIIIIFFFDT